MTLVKKLCLGIALSSFVFHMAKAESRPPYQYSEDEGKWVAYIRAGGAFYGSKDEYKLNSVPFEVEQNKDRLGTTVSIEGEISYFVSDHFSFSGSIGYHPQQATSDTWTITQNNEETEMRDTGKLSLLPMALLARYHMAPYGALRPYIGAGVHYTHPLDSYKLGKTDPSTGLVLNAGTDWWWSQDWGVSFDAKKYFMSIDRDLGALGIPLKQELTADPLVISAGLAVRI